MKKIIFYSILSFESLVVWIVIYHAELIGTINFEGSLEVIRTTVKNISLALYIIFTILLAYECLKNKEKK